MVDDYRDLGQYFVVFNEVAAAARYRGTVTYQELAHLIGLPIVGSYMGREIGKILGRISRAEHELKHPLLSAVAVTVGGIPGHGFFELATELEEFSGATEEERREFWETEIKRVHEHWRKKF
ncbi:MAG: hypothetical protein JO340_01130 [Acidobacteriaceae bacterium]|nr:hypothetical protein [Acidobacteriaceae bacterium]